LTYGVFDQTTDTLVNAVHALYSFTLILLTNLNEREQFTVERGGGLRAKAVLFWLFTILL